MDYQNITTDAELQAYCRELADCPSIAIDTEFVSENTFRPVLCLVQVAAGGRLAVLDPLTIGDLRPFWEIIVAPGHEIVVHAGRGEMEFCLASVGRLPTVLFDVQIAAGLVGIEFPAGYGNLIFKLLHEAPEKHETRTNWQARPLSKRQLDYAVDDAHYLPMLRDHLAARLETLGRRDWLDVEMRDWQADLQRAMGQERWRRVSGNTGLDARSLAIVRELWKWREAVAQRQDRPARHVLRDDLITELARRQTADVKRIRALRGMERRDMLRYIDDLAACIATALALPAEECPTRAARESSPQLSVLGQFLFAALGSICRQAELAPNLVGSPNDIRELLAWRSAPPREGRTPPRLAEGWRAEFVGNLFQDLLAGKIAVRVAEPNAECPLAFERTAG